MDYGSGLLLNDILHSLINGTVWDDPSATKMNALGTICDFADGRRFRYVKSIGTNDIAAGQPVSTSGGVLDVSAISATFFGADKSTAPVAGKGADVGDTVISFCDVTATITKDEYEDGYFVITTDNALSDGLGNSYKIVKNDAAIAGTVAAHEMTIAPGLRHLLDQTAAARILRNPWGFMDQAQNVTFATGVSCYTCGIAVRDVDMSLYPYYWIQTRGPCPVRITASGGAPADAGEVLSLGEDAAGGLEVPTDVNELIFGAPLAIAMEAISAGAVGMADLKFE